MIPHILFSAFCIYCSLTGASWLLSIITRNYSQVDRLWSIAPVIYVGWFAGLHGFDNERLNLIFALVAAWGIRLTYNFARKGGYRWGSEDYRWEALRRRLGPVKFQLFNATFIAPYQNLLLLLICAPALHVGVEYYVPINGLDVIAMGAFLFFLVGETIADQQQWNFHQRKAAAAAAGTPLPERFLTTGLFRYSRHPNFFCEQAIWWCVYLFSVAATGQWINLTIVGPILLTLLFQGSTAFTEKLTLTKYPEYADYQRRTSRLVPLPPSQ